MWGARVAARSTARGRLLGLGLLSALLPGGSPAAQTPDAAWRLTVRPHAMATATQNPTAGEYPLAAVPTALVTVPPACAGAHRCPLLVQLPGGGMPAREMTDWLRSMAEKYGLLLLALTDYATPTLDTALTEVLRRFAVEPNHLAISGRGVSGAPALHWGMNNSDVFSRVASISGGVVIDSAAPGPRKPEVFISIGFRELNGFEYADTLRHAGYTVKYVVALRGHEHQWEDYDEFGRWLRRSWARPNPAARPAPQVLTDPLPSVKPAMLWQLKAFWAKFLQEPDSIRTAARRAHLREVVVPVVDTRLTVVLTDMPALAAASPAVAADLKQAGLTAQQHDVYRVVLLSTVLSARVTGGGAAEQFMSRWTTPDASVIWDNIAFRGEFGDEFLALEQAGVPQPARLKALPTTRPHPRVTEALGPLGIWYTP